MNIFTSSRRWISMVGLVAVAPGCTTIGGSVRGDFACRAPKGDCAPMSAIDARAVAHLAEGNDLTIDRTILPATRFAQPSSGTGVGPMRTDERTLTILIPAHVDADGVLHDAATVHAVVEAPHWMLGTPKPSSYLARSSAPSSLRAGLAEAFAPATEGPGFSPARVPHPLIGVDATSPLPPGLLPSPSALAAAREGHRIKRSAVLPPLPKPNTEDSRVLLGMPTPLPTEDRRAVAAARVRALAAPLIAQAQGRPETIAEDNAAPVEGAPR